MPLIKGKSQESFDKNLKTEMHTGKPQAQALAIAYAMKRRAAHMKKAKGGMVEDEDQSPEQIKREAEMEHEPLSQELVEDESPEMEADEREHMAEGGEVPEAAASALGKKSALPHSKILHKVLGGLIEPDEPNLKENYLSDEHHDLDLEDDLYDQDFLSDEKEMMAEGGEVEEETPEIKRHKLLKKIMAG